MDFRLVTFLSVSIIAHSKQETELEISRFASLKHNVDLKIMILERKVNVGFLLFVFVMFHPTEFV